MALPAARQVADFGTSLVALPAPRGSRTIWESGDIVQDNGVPNVLINLANAVSGEVVSGVYAGEFEVTCATGVTASAGVDAFYDEANRTVVTAPGSGIIYLGTFETAKTSGQLVARVKLAGSAKVGPGVPINQRFVFTAAQINAGATILPAQAGLKYRVANAILIAVGGNAATATAVVLQGVQSASTVNLLSAAVAALAQNAWVAPSSANVTMLANADAQNDVNTALTIAKTGGALSGATSVILILTYELAA